MNVYLGKIVFYKNVNVSIGKKKKKNCKICKANHYIDVTLKYQCHNIYLFIKLSNLKE